MGYSNDATFATYCKLTPKPLITKNEYTFFNSLHVEDYRDNLIIYLSNVWLFECG